MWNIAKSLFEEFREQAVAEVSGHLQLQHHHQTTSNFSESHRCTKTTTA